MFDVPPPQEGVRGIDTYRETWPPFFEWQAGGASFDILSLDVTAGDDAPMPTPCCAAALPRSSPRALETACGSRWGCAKSRADGPSPTSTTPSRTTVEMARPMLPSPRPDA